MCLFLAKYTPTSLLQQKYTLIRQLPERPHKSQPSLQKSKIPTLEAFMWHLRNVDFQIPFTELQGVNMSLFQNTEFTFTQWYFHKYILQEFFCLSVSVHVSVSTLHISLFLCICFSVCLCLTLSLSPVRVCACVCVPHFVTKSFLFMFTLTIRVEFVATAHDQKDYIQMTEAKKNNHDLLNPTSGNS